MKTFTISLPDSLQTFVDQQLATKGFGDVSEYVFSLLREEEERQAGTRLEALLLDGLVRGGEDIPLTPAFWKDLESEALKPSWRVKRTTEALGSEQA